MWNKDRITCPKVHENRLFSYRRHDEMSRHYHTEYYRVSEAFIVSNVQQEFTKTVPQECQNDHLGRFDMGEFIDFLIRKGYVEIIDFDFFDFNPDTGLVAYVVDAT